VCLPLDFSRFFWGAFLGLWVLELGHRPCVLVFVEGLLLCQLLGVCEIVVVGACK